MKIKRNLPLTLLLLACGATAQAQQLFVADKLVLNVYALADQGSDRLATLQTGDAVELIERGQEFVLVRLEDGREGWVGANYLTSEPPAIIRLRQLQGEQKVAVQAAQKQSVDEIARLKQQNATLQSELDELKQQAAAPLAAPVVPAQPVDEFVDEPFDEVPQEAQTGTPISASVAGWMLAVVLGAGAAGFALGYQALARRIRQKFGGLKIY